MLLERAGCAPAEKATLPAFCIVHLTDHQQPPVNAAADVHLVSAQVDRDRRADPNVGGRFDLKASRWPGQSRRSDVVSELIRDEAYATHRAGQVHSSETSQLIAGSTDYKLLADLADLAARCVVKSTTERQQQLLALFSVIHSRNELPLHLIAIARRVGYRRGPTLADQRGSVICSPFEEFREGRRRLQCFVTLEQQSELNQQQLSGGEVGWSEHPARCALPIGLDGIVGARSLANDRSNMERSFHDMHRWRMFRHGGLLVEAQVSEKNFEIVGIRCVDPLPVALLFVR
jgi:hypothetical protein